MPPALKFEDFEARLAGTAPSEACVSVRVPAADETDLACEIHRPSGAISDLLVFYHGGGANRRAGYGRLAAGLVCHAPLAVCLVDMRGHGDSGGRRGHAEIPWVIWDDVDCVVSQMTRDFPGVAIHLGGHSSAAGMLLNYRTVHRPRTEVRSLVLLAPEFGYRAGLYRPRDRSHGPFARVRLWPFLLNAFSGGMIGGGLPAVSLNYQGSRLAEEIGCVSRYTVNMALAVTPADPAGQLGQLDLPTWVGIADEDELVDAAKLDAFLARHGPSALRREVIAGTTHLRIIVDAVTPVLAALGLCPGASSPAAEKSSADTPGNC